MDKSLVKMLIETLERIDEETFNIPTGVSIDAQMADDAPEGKQKVAVKGSKFSSYTGKRSADSVLNVGALISSLVSGTEFTDKDLQEKKPNGFN